VDEIQAKQALRALRSRAHHELQRLDGERQRVQTLIEFIDEYASDAPAPTPKPRRPRRQRPLSLLDTIRERPGIRTSMLAMIADRPSGQIAEELAGHERSGKIQRQGLGWIVANADEERPP